WKLQNLMLQPRRLGPGRALRHFDVVIPRLAVSAFGSWTEAAHPIPSSSAASSGVPQRRQITAPQSRQISGSITSTAHFGQYNSDFCGEAGLPASGIQLKCTTVTHAL